MLNTEIFLALSASLSTVLFNQLTNWLNLTWCRPSERGLGGHCALRLWSAGIDQLCDLEQVAPPLWASD